MKGKNGAEKENAVEGERCPDPLPQPLRAVSLFNSKRWEGHSIPTRKERQKASARRLHLRVQAKNHSPRPKNSFDDRESIFIRPWIFLLSFLLIPLSHRRLALPWQTYR
jgi:hypothetical protein